MANHETADAVKRFCLELRGYCEESSSTERRRTRLLNRILEAAKIQREPKRALSEQNAVFLGMGGQALGGPGCALHGGCGNNAEKQRHRPPFSAAFLRIDSGVDSRTPTLYVGRTTAAQFARINSKKVKA